MNTISKKRTSLILKEDIIRGIKKTKEIDIIAADNDVVFFVECKSREFLSRSDKIKLELAEFILNKEH